VRLTGSMRDALTQAHKTELRRVHDTSLPGRPPWPAHPATLAALERHGLISRTGIRNRKGYCVDIWSCTEAGRLVLFPPPRFREDKPEWLSWTGSGSDWTKDPARRADDGERMPEVSEGWRRRSERARLGAQDRKDVARRLARQARRAA
jgi:hypothetical protein